MADRLQRIFLIRHGTPLADAEVLSAQWELDPDHEQDLLALRSSGRLPGKARWFSSPEPKAVQTARALTTEHVEIVPDLREQVRMQVGRIEDVDAVVRRGFAVPDQPAHEGWETIERTRNRSVLAVRQLLRDHPDEDIVLVSHATTLTLLAADLTGGQADPELPGRMRMPDLMVIGLQKARPAPSLKLALILAALVFVGEAVLSEAGGRFGLITGGFLGLGAMLAIRSPTRRVGFAMLAGAVLGSAFALMAGNSIVPS